jgi:hypothetical protein
MMTNILINNEKYEEKDNNLNLSNLSNNIYKRMTNEEIITDIILDGESYPFEQGMDLLDGEVSQYTSIAFKTSTSTELAFQALDSCNGYIENLNGKILELCKLYQEGHTEKANVLFNEVIDVLDLYIQLISSIFTTLKRSRPSLLSNNKEVQQLEIHLLSVLKALVPAKERNDIIMLCDLLEYELIDNLTQWKIKAIPNLKALRNL